MKYFVAFLVSLLLFACGGGDDPTLSPASAHKNATTALVEPQNGWWWNPAESGSGYSIELQGNQIFMAAYLYETNGLATWYVSGLTRQSSGAYSGAMQRYSGGQSLLGTYKAPASTTSVVANALLSFNTASTGTLTITFADGSPSRTVALQRFAFAAGAPSNGSFDNGWWWNDSESGRGYFIEVQGSTAFIGSYMFDSTGQPTWYVSGAALQGSQTLSGALDQYTSGQSVGGSYKAPTKAAAGAGTMAFNFTSRTTANMILPNGKSVAMKRFIFSSLPTTNVAPVANAGFAQNVVAGTVVTLDGSASTDANGDALTYVWTLTAGPTGSGATLSSPTSAKPTFTADLVGTYVASLTVNDGMVNSATATVSIAVISTPQPVWTFSDDGAPLGITGVSPGAVILADGSVRIYVTDLNGSTVYRSSDGLVFHVEATHSIPGSDPTVLLLPDGSYRMYFVVIIGGVKTIMTATSSDGLSWSPSLSTGISNQAGSNAWGVPTAIRTSSGSIRLYWVESVPRQAETIESATSVDGVIFVRDSGHRATGGYVDPQIIKADASDWVAVFSTSPSRSPQEIHLATSTDGLAWTINPNPIITVAGKNALDPVSVRLGSNTFRVYYSVSEGSDPFSGTFTLHSGILKLQ